MSAPTVEQLRRQFIAEVSRQTGIDPGVVDQWTGREGAYAPHGTGGLNFLNLRPYKSDTGVVAHSSGGFDQFGDVNSAVDSTVARIKQPFLQQFLAPAIDKGPEAQWNAIATSGWDAGHYGHAPLAAAGGSTIPDSVGGLNTSQLAQPDLAGARQHLLSFLMGNVQRHEHGSPEALSGELQQLRPLLMPEPEKATVPASTAAQPGPSVQTPQSGNLSAIPDAIATRPGLQVDSAILPSVSRIAQAFGVKANSGHRTAEHNAAVGGAPDSDHLHGGAVDFVGSPEAMQALHEWAQSRFPYVEPMSESRDHVHISFIR